MLCELVWQVLPFFGKKWQFSRKINDVITILAFYHFCHFLKTWYNVQSSFAAVFSSPILYFYYTAEIPNYGTQCWITFGDQWQWQLYMTLVSISLFVSLFWH
jgi:hypothetical protein